MPRELGQFSKVEYNTKKSEGFFTDDIKSRSDLTIKERAFLLFDSMLLKPDELKKYGGADNIQRIRIIGEGDGKPISLDFNLIKDIRKLDEKKATPTKEPEVSKRHGFNRSRNTTKLETAVKLPPNLAYDKALEQRERQLKGK